MIASSDYDIDDTFSISSIDDDNHVKADITFSPGVLLPSIKIGNHHGGKRKGSGTMNAKAVCTKIILSASLLLLTVAYIGLSAFYITHHKKQTRRTLLQKDRHLSTPMLVRPSHRFGMESTITVEETLFDSVNRYDKDEPNLTYQAGASYLDKLHKFLDESELKEFDSHYHIEKAVKDVTSLKPPIKDDWKQAFSKRHPALTPMDSQYVPHFEWKATGIADINIAGHDKASMAQLYRIIASHQYSTPFHPRSMGYCVLPAAQADRLYAEKWQFNPAKNYTEIIDDESIEIQSQLYQFYCSNHERLRYTTRQTVNGCTSAADLQLSWYYLKPNMDYKKYIYLFRDPADLVYSFYMRHVLPNRETDEFDNEPQVFHDLLLSSPNAEDKRLFRHLLRKPLQQARQLLSYAKYKNVLFLRAEDMMADKIDQPGGLLDKISRFTGLSLDGFDRAAIDVDNDCGHIVGGRPVGGCSQSSPDGDSFTDIEPMHSETRTLLYMIAQQECIMWKRLFGIEYPDCINVVKSAKETQ
jgi:Sulfotransferase domain